MKKIFSVEQVKGFSIIGEDLIEKLKDVLPSEEDIEGFTFEHDGKWYGLVDVYQDDEIDEGKYTNGCMYHQLYSYDKSIASYITAKNVIDEFALIVKQPYSKSGSYYSDYEWYYEKPRLISLAIKLVPEVVIPEHEEVDFLNIK